MVKVLNREGIQRMVGTRVAGAGGSGGSSGGGSGISLAQVDAAYVSKDFFNQLFTVHGKRTYTDPDTQEEVTEDVVITPNQIAEGEYSLSNVEVSVGLWTNSFLSALGLGTGGGGGATALTDLVDVALSNPQNGQVLMYNSSTGKWYNGTVQSGGGGTVTSITAGTGLSGGTITTMGTIAISSTYQTRISHGETAYGWGNHANAGYLTKSAISDMATKTWVGQQGFLTSHQSVDGTFWGQSWSNHGTVTGDMTNVGRIFQTGNFTLMNYQGIGLMIEGSAVTGSEYRVTFGFHSTGALAWLNNNHIMQLKADTSTGENWVHIENGILQIGDARLVWDSTNNALKAVKADGTAINFYATGGVSALGMSAGVSQIDAMTFNHLSVKNSLTLSGSVSVITGSSSQIIRSSGDGDCIYLLNFGTTSKVTSKNYYYNQYDNIGLHGTNYNYDETWFIDPDGCAKFNRLYLDSTRYLYINGGTLYYYNGSTSRQIAFT